MRLGPGFKPLRDYRIAVGRCTPHARRTACGVVACFLAISLIVASSISGGEAWKAFIALLVPPIEECAVTAMPALWQYAKSSSRW